MRDKAVLIFAIFIIYLRAETVNLGLLKNCNPSGNCGQVKQFEGQHDFNRFVDKQYLRGPRTYQQYYEKAQLQKKLFFQIRNEYEIFGETTKTDGTYIYSISGSSITIVKAYPAETSEVASKIDEGQYKNYYNLQLLIYKDTLAVFREKETWKNGIKVANPQTSVWIYNVSDRSKPQLKNRFIVSGQYRGSYLLKNGLVYFLSSSQMNESKILPSYDIGNGKIPFSWSNIYYYPQWLKIHNRPHFLNIIRFDLNNPQSTFLTTSFVLYNELIYSSKQNIYIVQNDYGLGQLMISKIVVNKDYIRPIAFTIVNGTISSYSFSEFQGYFRIVTTNKNEKNETSSNLFILSYYLNIYGKLTNIALNKRIFSCSFLNKKLYLVTYRQIDPFFVVDLSNPALPVLLGQIKFPSHYTYFQPYPNNQNAVIGFGEKVIDQNKEKVIQATIFNTSNPLSPTEISSDNIPSKYMHIQTPYPFQFYNLLLAPHKNMLVIPIQTGALLFYISPKRITLKSVVQHLQGQQNNQIPDYKNIVWNIVYIKDTLYTQSMCKLISTDLTSYKNVKTISLGCQE